MRMVSMPADLARLTSWTSVAAYGATGDGATDDTAAIRAAYAACTTGGTLFFPAGTYLLKSASSFTAGLSVAKAITLLGQPGATIKAHASAPTGIRLFEIKTANVTVSGLSFDPNGISSGTCCHLANASFVTISDCIFTSPKSGALLLDGAATDVLFTRNRVSGAGYGVLANDVAGTARIAISNNLFNGGGNTGSDAVEFNGVNQTFTDISVTGNTITGYASSTTNNGFGIAFSRVTRGVIANNTVSACGRNGIHLENLTKLVAVTGNVVSGCNHAGIEVQGESLATCSALVIANNTVSGCCLAPTVNLGNGGIEVGSSTAAPFTGNGATNAVVSGNLVDACQGCGVWLFGVLGAQVSGNVVRNIYGLSTDTANSVQNSGMHVVSCNNSQIKHNLFYDSQGGSATLFYPIYFYGTAVGVVSSGNHYAGNLGGAQDNTTGVSKSFEAGTGQAFRFDGGHDRVGFYGATPIVKPTGTAANATDLATALTLVNDLKAKLVALGAIA